MKQLINEFKGIIWPNKKNVKKEFIIVIISSILGILFIEVINLIMSGIFSAIGLI